MGYDTFLTGSDFVSQFLVHNLLHVGVDGGAPQGALELTQHRRHLQFFTRFARQ